MYRAFSAGPLGVEADFEHEVELAAHYGFAGVYLDTGYLIANGPETVVQMLEERGLRPAGWTLPVSPMAAQDEFEAQLERLGEVAEASSRAACRRTCIWLPPGSDELSYEEMFDFLRQRLSRVAAVLAENDVRLGLEFIGPATSRRGREHEFIHTMDGMLELCRAVGTGNVGLLLDCWHLYTSGGSMDDVLGLTDDDVVNVHINDAPAGVALEEQIDNVRCLPGETGVIDVTRFLRCLQQIGYSGPVMVEPFNERLRQMPKDDALAAVVEAIEGVWPD